MSNVVERARAFAIAAHAAIGQTRKDGVTPYYRHVIDVAQRTSQYGHDEMVAAAYLHDVLEDTKVTLDDLLMVFGHAVTRLVVELTDQHAFPADSRPRAARKADERARLASCSAEAQTIKLCDIASNLADTTGAEFEYKFRGKLLIEFCHLIEALNMGNHWAREAAIAALVTATAQHEADRI